MRWPMAAQLGIIFLLLVAPVMPLGCGSQDTTSDYEQQMMQARVQRDMDMREKESVLPPDRREEFLGLDFYGVDPAYRFVRPLRRNSSPDTVLMAETGGGVAPQVRVGTITVPLSSGKERLRVFRGSSSETRGRLWIPFADSTNGQTTYEAGRYIDLEPQGTDSVLVDFNRAYNPTCAYNPDYACPIPPQENHIDGPVPVGEKAPLFEKNASS